MCYGYQGNKRAPIHPQQLMTDRLHCTACERNDSESENLGKCACCGIGTNDFIRGSLLEIYAKHTDYPIVLIEQVVCREVQNSDAYRKAVEVSQMDDGFIPLEGENFQDYYVKRLGSEAKVYYVFDLSDHFIGKGKCGNRRKEESDFDKGCVQSDLQVAMDIMEGKADASDNGKYKKTPDDGISVAYYTYTCRRNDDCPLTEMAFPIRIDGRCIAVMIVGQIGQIAAGNCECGMDEELRKDIANRVNDFSERMRERAALRRTDYLYRLLSKLYQSQLLVDSAADDVGEKIKQVYQEINKAFDYKKLTVYYTDKDQIAGYSSIRFPDPENSKNTPDIPYDGFVKALYAEDPDAELRALLGVKKEDKSIGLYKQCSSLSDETAGESMQCFILTCIEWKEAEGDGYRQFFDSLNARLFSFLMTRLAIEKKQEQDVLIHTFSHDLNQKLEIIRNHTKILDEKKDRWYPDRDSDAYNDVRDYIKDVTNLEMQLRKFTKEVLNNDKGLPKQADIRSFFPYGAFLFNLQEYYNSSADAGRRLIMPSPGTVAINVADYPFMRADQVLIERCVNNLLSNAFKYSYRYTNVYLDCQHINDRYVIDVINFASPIRDDIKDKMFEMGISQSKIRGYRQEKGKGYGLAIVRQICKLHNGEVCCMPEEEISDYNIPVLNRLITVLYAAKGRGTEALAEQLKKYRISETEYAEIAAEYERLRALPVGSWQNRVAFLINKQNTLQEVCASPVSYSEMLTAPSLRMSLKMPTVRIRFRITLPQ